MGVLSSCSSIRFEFYGDLWVEIAYCVALLRWRYLDLFVKHVGEVFEVWGIAIKFHELFDVSLVFLLFWSRNWVW